MLRGAPGGYGSVFVAVCAVVAGFNFQIIVDAIAVIEFGLYA